MSNSQNKESIKSSVKITGSIILPKSISKKQLLDKLEEFLEEHNLDFIGEIGDTIPILKLNKNMEETELLSCWNSVLKVIKNELTEVSFNTWLKPIIPYSIDDNSIILLVENHFNKGILEGRYLKLIMSALKLITEKEMDVNIFVKDEIQI